MKETHSLLNNETGEATPLRVRIPRNPSIGGNWLMSFQDALCDIILSKDIPPESLRVFGIMFKYTQFENGITITQKEIGYILGINAQRVSKAVRILIEQGIIMKLEKTPDNPYVYYLSPTVGWKGKARNYHAFMREQTREAHSSA